MSNTDFELAARPGHPTLTDIVAYAGIGLGIALQAFTGHPTSTDIVARAGVYYQAASVAPPSFPTQYAGLRYYSGSVKELCLVAEADAPSGMGGVWKITKGGVNYAVYLVETSDPNASGVRLQTSSGIKSARLKT
jgi:hypothetical protein